MSWHCRRIRSTWPDSTKVNPSSFYSWFQIYTKILRRRWHLLTIKIRCKVSTWSMANLNRQSVIFCLWEFLQWQNRSNSLLFCPLRKCLLVIRWARWLVSTLSKTSATLPSIASSHRYRLSWPVLMTLMASLIFKSQEMSLKNKWKLVLMIKMLWGDSFKKSWLMNSLSSIQWIDLFQAKIMISVQKHPS